jgi:plastocyanin
MTVPQKMLLGAVACGVAAGSVALFWQNHIPARAEPADLRGQMQIEILFTEDGFLPRDIRIDRGSSVQFTTNTSKYFWPASNLHPSHDIYSDFDPRRPLAPEESWSFTFERPGIWGYHDHIRSYYTGVIYVE